MSHKFTVSEDVEIVVNGERILLEKGDVIIVEAYGADPVWMRAKSAQEDQPFKPVEDRDREVIKGIINDLMKKVALDVMTPQMVVDAYNKEYRGGGEKFDPEFIEEMMGEVERQQIGLMAT